MTSGQDPIAVEGVEEKTRNLFFQGEKTRNLAADSTKSIIVTMSRKVEQLTVISSSDK